MTQVGKTENPKSEIRNPKSLYLRPEAELLLCCARTRMDSECAERIQRLLQAKLNWDYLLSLAKWHRLLPLLYWNLSQSSRQAIPPAIFNELRHHFRANTERNMFLTKELLRVLKLFEANGIRAIPYKGAILAETVYGNLSLRQFRDLDILVHRQDVLKAKNLLIFQGYQPEFLLTEKQESAYLQSDNQYPLIHEQGWILELHWGIVHRHFFFPIDFEQMWQRLEPIYLGGRTIYTFRPEELLLILAVHGSHHIWARLKWNCDVAELLHVHPELDWEWVMAQARMRGIERLLLLSLFIANALFDAAIPETVSKRIQADPMIKPLAEQVYERFFREENEMPGTEEHLRFYFIVRERWRDRLRALFGLVRRATTPSVRDGGAERVSPRLSFLDSPLRLIRLIGKYGVHPLLRFLRARLKNTNR